MKRIFISFPLFFIFCLLQAESFGSIPQSPLLFSENKGQIVDEKGDYCPQVLFSAKAKGIDIYVGTTSIKYIWTSMVGNLDMDATDSLVFNRYAMEMLLLDSNPSPAVRKEWLHESYDNFYLPQCPNGITQVRKYQRIIFEEVYPLIDWVIYSDLKNKQGFKYEFHIKPGGDPSQIKWEYKGATEVRSIKDGSLQIQHPMGYIKDSKPVSFQYLSAEDSTLIKTRFQQSDPFYSFALDAYDPDYTLIIDPELAWATFYGGSSQDLGYGISTDKDLNIHICGRTYSPSYMSFNGFQTSLGGEHDAFIAKFDPQGNRIWATYYGGSRRDHAFYILADSSANVYITGETWSTDVIAHQGHQNSWGAGGNFSDAFLIKFNSSGIREWGTYYGGTSQEFGLGMAIDKDQRVYICGQTASPNNIAFNGFKNSLSPNNQDGFFAKFTPTGQRVWGSYYGGENFDEIEELAIDEQGDIYLIGVTKSLNGIAENGHQNTNSGGFSDGFIVKFDAALNRKWGTYYGGSGKEWLTGIVLDQEEGIYVRGLSNSSTDIVFNGVDRNLPDPFWDTSILLKFDRDGNRIWGRYFDRGGNPYFTTINRSNQLAIDRECNVYMAGYTQDTTLMPNGFQEQNAGLADNYIAKFNAGGEWIWGSFFGGDSLEGEVYLALDKNDNIYLSGTTLSQGSDFSYQGFQMQNNGTWDAFLAKISSCAPINFTLADTFLCEGSQLLLLPESQESYSYKWYEHKDDRIPVYKDSTGQGFLTPVIDVNTTYYVSAIGEPGCESKRQPISIAILPAITVSINPPNPAPLCPNESLTLTAGPMPGDYLWQDGTTGDRYVATGPGEYWVQLTDSAGCQASDSLVIEIKDCNELIMPNVFSPNDDGINDEFLPISFEQLENFSLHIFDRWGRAIFEGSNPSDGWDGSWEGKPVREGTYFWVIQYVDSSGQNHVRRGNMLLMR